MAYTKEELDEFRQLVVLGESPRQMDRITSRLEMRNFVTRLGKDKCDEMFVELCKEYKNPQPEQPNEHQ